jgi:hypothetical protein
MLPHMNVSFPENLAWSVPASNVPATIDFQMVYSNDREEW